MLENCHPATVTSWELLFQNAFLKLNAFSSCIIRVVNFPRYNIDGSKLISPMVLFRYFSLKSVRTIFPAEIRHFNFTLWLKYYHEQKDENYINSTFTYKFTNSNKKCNCEVQVDIEPPDRNQSPRMYFMMYQDIWILKHPSQLSYAFTDEQHDWKEYHVNTLSIYSILITGTQILTSDCTSDACQTWMYSAWVSPYLVKPNQQLLIWKLTETVTVFGHCKFCDPCRPNMFLDLSQDSSGNTSPHQIQQTIGKKPIHLSIKVVMRGNVWEAFMAMMRSKNKHMFTEPYDNIRLRPKVAHAFAIAAIVPNNASIQFVGWFAEGSYSYKYLYMPECLGQESVKYFPNLRLEIKRVTFVNIANFPDPGLIFETQTLRFVACHSERNLWHSRLRELISPFDVSTWLLGFTAIFTLTTLMVVQQRNANLSLGTACFALCCLLLEKGHRIFDWSAEKSKGFGYFITFGISFVLLVLSNEYRGENISKLTVAPDLYPFDNFDDLVSHRFPIFTFATELIEYDYSNLLRSVNVSTEFQKVSNHEYFPIVSILWLEIMLQWIKWNTLESSSQRLANRTWFYLNHTQIYGHDKFVSTDIGSPSDVVEEITKNWFGHAVSQLRQCNYSAMIMYRAQALTVHANLSSVKAPAFLGRDTIYENMYGYTLFGQMPGSIYKRTKYFLESGILESWHRYREYWLVWSTHSKGNHNVDKYISVDQKTNSAVSVILFVLSIGFIIGFVLLLFECIYARNKFRRSMI